MIINEEVYLEIISPLNILENEKEAYDFCQLSESEADLQAFRKTCFERGGVQFVHLIDDRIEELQQNQLNTHKYELREN